MFYSLQDNYNISGVNNVETNNDIMGEVITEVNSDVENIQVQDISKAYMRLTISQQKKII